MKLLSWDIESSDLVADYGRMLCLGFKTVGGRGKNARIISLGDYKSYEVDPTHDKALVKEAAKILSDCDAWLTWYGSRFDVPFVNSRLIYHDLPPLPPIPHIDGWRVARSKLRLHSNRLASVSAFLDVEEKTPIKPNVWVRAKCGHRPSLNYVIQHCKQDVIVLEQVYEHLKPLIDQHPNSGLFSGNADACPACGGFHITRQGERVTKTRTYPRFQCQDCGMWLRGTKSDGRADYISLGSNT
jgi:hypothetical protein